MVLKSSWEQALAWRMRRHLLDPDGGQPIAVVVRLLDRDLHAVLASDAGAR